MKKYQFGIPGDWNWTLRRYNEHTWFDIDEDMYNRIIREAPWLLVRVVSMPEPAKVDTD